MVGPAAKRPATVRRFSAMFVAGARLTVPPRFAVLRKAYGLGAMAMAGGDLPAPLVTVAWPTGEFGGMGLEGAVPRPGERVGPPRPPLTRNPTPTPVVAGTGRDTGEAPCCSRSWAGCCSG
jgi:hypothetical protein